MSYPLKCLIVAGARPNFMKVAPLLWAIRRHNESGNPPKVEPILVHTGQHYDPRMSDVFFRDLGIPAPDVNLEVGSGTHAAQTAQIMLRFEPVCLEHRPDWIVVVGDVNSTVACTLVASKLGLRVAHVEAGLRSFDRSMPEEINRLVTDALADLLLTPSEDADENLRREGVDPARIRLVGNILIDSLVASLPRARESRILHELGLKPRRFVYVTLHRPSNVDHRETLAPILETLADLARSLPVVFPIHPRTRARAESFGLKLSGRDGLHVVEPVGYLDSVRLAEDARLVLTDSGGLQEETTYLRTPCLTLRPNTERPITITRGSNRLTALDRLQNDLREFLDGPPARGEVPPLWDGATGGRVLEALIQQSAAPRSSAKP